MPQRPLPEIIYYEHHGCHARHRTYRALAKCRWPRPTHREHVFGEGPHGFLLVDFERYYNADTGEYDGALAWWPDVYLFTSEKERDYEFQAYWNARSGWRHLERFNLCHPSQAEYRDRRLEVRGGGPDRDYPPEQRANVPSLA